ncbi:hypothetical protein M3Y95_00721700 [Aphelenchoides besseyi]|nr:hypothetical protein M3Y95_00721700 [Aphelenchoides besseyi]
MSHEKEEASCPSFTTDMVPVNSAVSSKSFNETELLDDENGKARAEFAFNSSTPSVHPGHHRDKLDLIRDSLKPFEQTENQVPVLNSYSSPSNDLFNSSQQVDANLQRIMMHALTQVGYDQESAYYALKLVNFRSITDAVMVLTNSRHSDKSQQPQALKSQLPVFNQQTPTSAYSNGSRNGSPLEFYSTSHDERPTTSSFLSSTKSLPMESNSPTVFDANGNNGVTVNGKHLPMFAYPNQQHNGRLTPEFPSQSSYRNQTPNMQKPMSSRTQLKQAASLEPMAKFNNNEHETEGNNFLSNMPNFFHDFPRAQSLITRSQMESFGNSKPNFSKKTAQKPGLHSVNSTPAKLVNSVSRIVVDPDRIQSTTSLRELDSTSPIRQHHYSATEESRSDESLQHISNLRIDDTRTVSPPQPTISINGKPINQTGPIRSVSPLPPSVARRLYGNEKFESVIKPCKASMFTFYMEQHTEKVVQQYKERNRRAQQLTKEMELANMSDVAKERMLRYLRQKESRYIRLKRQKMNKNMFDLIRHIGVGAFGKVTLVRKRDTNEVYAMKTLSKADVIQKQQAAHVKAERDILAEANSDWVVKLYFSFQDAHNLYFIMEYVPGGDLMQLLINKGIFTESLAKRYTAELTCAIEYVHGLGFIHRDIKPDNILIDKEGHIKLTDFGLCTGLRWTHEKRHYVSYDDPDQSSSHNRNDSLTSLNIANGNDQLKLLQIRQRKERSCAHSVVGTGNYMSPEVCARTGHTKLCDWWSVGVILYEMVYGRPPFLSQTDDPGATQYMILHWPKYLNLNNPAGARLSRACIDIIAKLCCDEKDRLGKNGASEVKAHQWFKDINFTNLRETAPEFVPKVQHAEDTSNFDTFEVKMEEFYRDTYRSDKYNPAFFDFTFRHFFASDGINKHPYHASKNQQRPRLPPVFERPAQSELTIQETNEQAKTEEVPETKKNVEVKSSVQPKKNVRTASPRMSVHPITHPIVNRQLRQHEPPTIYSAYVRGGENAPFSHTIKRYGNPNDQHSLNDDTTQSFV